jgi:hypothetical protein
MSECTTVIKNPQRYPNIIIVGDIHTILSPIDRSFIQKFNRKTSELNDTIEQMDIADICRIFYPAATKQTFFSPAHSTLSKTDHILGHKTSLSKYKKLK